MTSNAFGGPPGAGRAPHRAPGDVGLQRSRRVGWLVASGSLGVCALLGVALAHEIPGTTAHVATAARSGARASASGTTAGSSSAGEAETGDTGSSARSSGSAGTSPGTSATTTGGSAIVSGGSAP